jgi:ABC-type transport system involved in multi-copper enzyme maturation permease subunit
MRGLLQDTFAELRSQKMVWVFAFVLFGALLAVMASGNIQIGSGKDLDPNMPFQLMLSAVVLKLLSGTLQFLVFLMAMSTAGIIPSMFEKGRADFYLSKPMTRSGLLWNKVGSILIVYASILAFAGVAILATGATVHDVFEFRWLVVLPTAVFLFAIWYSVSLFAGLALGSGTSAIVVTFMVWVLQAVLTMRESIKTFFDSQVVSVLIDALYWIIPKPGEIDNQVTNWALNAGTFEWWAIGSSATFMVVVYLGASEILKRRDF